MEMLPIIKTDNVESWNNESVKKQFTESNFYAFA